MDASATLLASAAAHVDPLLAALFVLLGLGSWIFVNGVFQALPLVANSAPESYDIFSWVSIAVAAANVFPALYLLLLPRCRRRKSTAVDDAQRLQAIECATTLAVLLGGALVCLALALSWRGTSTWPASLDGGGTAVHSTPLILLSFVGGGADCMTSVLFYPFAALFPPAYTPALIAGESLTGLLAALGALAMGGGDGGGGGGAAQRFSVGAFFGGLATVMLVALAAFVALAFGGRGRRARRVPSSDASQRGMELSGALAAAASNAEKEGAEAARAAVAAAKEEEAGSGAAAGCCGLFWDGLPAGSAARRAARRLLVGQALLAVVENGVHATLVPHCLALYPHKALLVSAATKAGYGGASLVTVLAYWRPLRLRDGSAGGGDGARWAALAVAVAAGTLWMLVTAGAVVAPGSAVCGWLTAGVTVAVKWLVTYLKASLFLCHHHAGSDVFRFGGIGIQLGSCGGALLFFVLTVTADVFND